MREALTAFEKLDSGNPGQVHSKFMGKHENDGAHKRKLVQRCVAAAKQADASGNASPYSLFYDRWKKGLPTSATGRQAEMTLTGRLALGLGIPNPLEVGIHLHPVFGLPMIPGSSIKGASAHHCHGNWGKSQKEFLVGGDHHRWLFGTVEAGQDPDAAGMIIFHDAIWKPHGEPLVEEVMTPHHLDYQNPKGDAYPTDFDNPTPIPFVGSRGSFLVALEFRGPPPADPGELKKLGIWLDLAMDLVRETLAVSGFGGKTTSGYGLFIDPSGIPQQGAKRPMGTAVPSLTLTECVNNQWFGREPDGKTGRVQGNVPNHLKRAGAVIRVAIQDDTERNRIYRDPRQP